MTDHLTLAQIAQASGIPARTIRFYIARGLVSGPVKSGRGAHYTPEHLARIQRIKELQSGGRTLAEISALVAGPAPSTAAPSPTPWWQHAIADDLVVWVRADASPWRLKQVRDALQDLSLRLKPSVVSPSEEEENQ